MRGQFLDEPWWAGQMVLSSHTHFTDTSQGKKRPSRAAAGPGHLAGGMMSLWVVHQDSALRYPWLPMSRSGVASRITAPYPPKESTS